MPVILTGDSLPVLISIYNYIVLIAMILNINKTKRPWVLASLLAGLITVAGLQSCKDFLDEELTTQRNNDYYKTEEGILSLVPGGYREILATPFENELQYTTTNYGTDEFAIGGDDSNNPWNN